MYTVKPLPNGHYTIEWLDHDELENESTGEEFITRHDAQERADELNHMHIDLGHGG